MECLKETIKNNPKSTKYKITYTDLTSSVERLFIASDNAVCKYVKYAKRYGYRLKPEQIISIEQIVPKKLKSEEQLWQESWTKVSKRLAESGLWQEVKDNIDIGLEVGYEKIKQANDLYWNTPLNIKLPWEHNQRAIEIEKLESRLIKNNSVNIIIVWNMSRPARIKKMYFGKYREYKLLDIAEALKNDIDFSTHSTAGYDVSFNYNSKQKKAWYSEEYRGCGNGHYYLALDSTHALYYEDD